MMENEVVRNAIGKLVTNIGGRVLKYMITVENRLPIITKRAYKLNCVTGSNAIHS